MGTERTRSGRKKRESQKAGKVDQWIKALAAKCEDLNLIPRAHVV